MEKTRQNIFAKGPNTIEARKTIDKRLNKTSDLLIHKRNKTRNQGQTFLFHYVMAIIF